MTSETDIIKMLEFFIDNIVVVYLCSFLPVLYHKLEISYYVVEFGSQAALNANFELR
jgi:hypothetical protein